ncbi:MAG: hypothetical protein AB7V32_00320 [Candidatus Berkiella sp.]
MTKVVILPISLYLDNEQNRTLAAFKRLGVGSLSLFWHYIPLPKWLEKFRGLSLPVIFDRYRKGELSTQAFKEAIRQKFPTARLDNQSFDTAWNEMQVVTDVTKKALEEAQQLQEQGYQVYLLAGTNALHVQDLKNKLNLKELPGTAYFSFEQKKLGRDLFGALLKNIKEQNKDITADDIAFFYTPPADPYPWLGRLAWLNPFAIVKNFEFFQARKYVQSLKKEAESKNGFKLICTQPKACKQPNIIASIQQLGWMESARKLVKDNPPVTHLRSARKKGATEQKQEPKHHYYLRAKKR